MKLILATGLIPLLLSCAHPRLESWNGQQFTVCCDRCKKEDWAKSIATYCDGSATSVGGYKEEKITGATTTQNDFFGTTNTAFNKKKESCRVFKCSGTVNVE